MTYIIGIVSQKGGVGKSTLARLIAREAAQGGVSVKIADLDHQQQTSAKWQARRAENGIKPEIRVEVFQNVKTALSEAQSFDVYVLDGAPHSSKDTALIAKAASLIVIPTSDSDEDLEPAVLLAHDLKREGVPIDRIAFALCLISDSAKEVRAAREYLQKTPYKLLDGEVPFRTGFRQSLARGKAITETPFKSLVRRADKLAQSVIDAAAQAGERKAA
ncbi:MAG: hypothetical protein COA43_16550 [Robiginitomaculum sp.]|nr:MAG: hypothetical protein COA43_16550 [Robiginitomaculum sp.]